MPLHMTVAYQEWPYREVFAYARARHAVSRLFVCNLSDGTHIGRGECGLQTLKNETSEQMREELEDIASGIARIGDRETLNREIPAGSARNAVDCAFWDLACKRERRSVWTLANIPPAPAIEVDISIGINDTDKMCADARGAAGRGYRLLKLKADAETAFDKIAAIAEGVPGMRFIVDANEAWTLAQLKSIAPKLARIGVEVIEQPLHHDRDADLEGYHCPIPLCADESCATRENLDVLARRYQAINIKLDKAGGLTEALALARSARARGLELMVGCNGATSLGNAPAYVVGTLSKWRDIDSHELLYEDRAAGMTTRNGKLQVFEPALWG